MTPKPTLAIITNVIDNRQAKGTALVAKKLLDQLDKIKRDFDITLIHSSKTTDEIYTKYHEIIIPQRKFIFASTMINESLFWLKLRRQRKSFNIIHYMQPRVWPSYLLAPAKKIIITMHEAGIMLNLHPIGLGEHIFRVTNKYLNFRMDHIIAVSEYGKKEIAQYCHIKSEKIHVVYNGIDEKFIAKTVNEELVTKIQEKYNIPKDYLLSVGRLDPHKNILKLIEAYKIFRENGGVEKLVLVGGKHMKDYSDQVDMLIKNLNLQNEVVITSFILDEDMPYMYSLAKALVYPSLHEGFGLPLIEAFACNTPVTCSNVTSLPEVAGRGALLFDPNDVQEIAESMLKITTDQNSRRELIMEGQKRLKNFTWDKSAENLFSLYKKIIFEQ